LKKTLKLQNIPQGLIAAGMSQFIPAAAALASPSPSALPSPSLDGPYPRPRSLTDALALAPRPLTAIAITLHLALNNTPLAPRALAAAAITPRISHPNFRVYHPRSRHSPQSALTSPPRWYPYPILRNCNRSTRTPPIHLSKPLEY
jgi:hypothetical protein